MLKRTVYEQVVWYNHFDASATDQWYADFAREYRETWPNYRTEIEPVAKDGEALNLFTLRGLTAGQLAKIDNMSGSEKLREIVAYGVADWSGMADGDDEVKPTFTKDALGQRMTSKAMDFLGFFGFPDLPLVNILAVQVLTISRSLK